MSTRLKSFTFPSEESSDDDWLVVELASNTELDAVKQNSNSNSILQSVMAEPIFPDSRVFKFLKVEEYFHRIKEWHKLGDVLSRKFDARGRTLSLEFETIDYAGEKRKSLMVVQLPQNDVLRVRFNPVKKHADEYRHLTRLAEMGLFDTDDEELQKNEVFDIEHKETDSESVLLTKSKYNDVVMKVVVTLKPFGIRIYNQSELNQKHKDTPVWETSEQGIYYTPHGKEDFAMVQSINNHANAKYIGFGEQGGTKLAKNTDQLNYFNLDNMRYRQVYNRGPLDNREPLYHSEPFFYEFNGVPGSPNVNAVLIDNPSQVFIDVAYMNSKRLMFGTRFGDLDYYVFLGNDPKNILDSLTAIVGRPALKPRYCLGYHQGCYGYENRADLEWAVRTHREYGIPLDGLAVDVDVQDNYRTFTINTDKYPDPKGMFSWLRSQGVKCSTNITPVISCQDKHNPCYYSTYHEGLKNDFFVTDHRYDAHNPDSKVYQLYGSGHEFRPNEHRGREPEGYNSGEPYIGEVYYGNDDSGKELGSPGHYPDLGRPEVREWWGKQYKYLFEMGLEFVWQDMTTPAIRDFRGDMKGFPFKLLVSENFRPDKVEKVPSLKVWNLYSYNLHRATFEGLDNLHNISPELKWRENRRNFIIGRGSYVGSHRYAGLWTGDNSSDWDFLQMNISQILSLGMHGLAITGQDVGGFEASHSDEGKWASPELMIRWTASGAFLPWFRNHYVRKGRKEFQEVFQYVEWFNKYRGGQIPEPRDMYYAVLPICKYYIELRYRLMQAFYDCLFENTLNGMPICRPLFLVAPNDESLYNDKEQFLNNEFFVGNDILVAPVLRPQYENNNAGRRDIYLPHGSSWYNFVDNTSPLHKKLEGGSTIRDYDASINAHPDHLPFVLPIFIRAGAIVPTILLEQYVGQLNAEGKPNPITLNVYPGADGQYTMYLDDGISRSSAPADDVDDPKANDEYRKVNITNKWSGDKTQEVTVERVHDKYKPVEDHFFVSLLHDPTMPVGANGPVREVTVNGTAVPQVSGFTTQEKQGNLHASPKVGCYYDPKTATTHLKVFDNNAKITIKATYH